MFRYFVRRYGCALNFDTGTEETFHKVVVGQPFRTDCRRMKDRELRLARRADVILLLTTVMDEDIPDPQMRVPKIRFSRCVKRTTLGSFLTEAGNMYPYSDAARQAMRECVRRSAVATSIGLEEVCCICYKFSTKTVAYEHDIYNIITNKQLLMSMIFTT